MRLTLSKLLNNFFPFRTRSFLFLLFLQTMNSFNSNNRCIFMYVFRVLLQKKKKNIRGKARMLLYEFLSLFGKSQGHNSAIGSNKSYRVCHEYSSEYIAWCLFTILCQITNKFHTQITWFWVDHIEMWRINISPILYLYSICSPVSDYHWKKCNRNMKKNIRHFFFFISNHICQKILSWD